MTATGSSLRLGCGGPSESWDTTSDYAPPIPLPCPASLPFICIANARSHERPSLAPCDSLLLPPPPPSRIFHPLLFNTPSPLQQPPPPPPPPPCCQMRPEALDPCAFICMCRVSVLEGGLPAWKAVGGELETAPVPEGEAVSCPPPLPSPPSSSTCKRARWTSRLPFSFRPLSANDSLTQCCDSPGAQAKTGIEPELSAPAGGYAASKDPSKVRTLQQVWDNVEAASDQVQWAA